MQHLPPAGVPAMDNGDCCTTHADKTALCRVANAQKKHTPLLCSIKRSVPKPNIAARPLVASARGLNHPTAGEQTHPVRGP